MSFFPDITPLIKELQEFKNQQVQIITLLEEQNKILQQILKKYDKIS